MAVTKCHTCMGSGYLWNEDTKKFDIVCWACRGTGWIQTRTV